MKKTTFEVATALAATVLAGLLLREVEVLPDVLRWIVLAVVFGLTFVLAWWATGRKEPDFSNSGVGIGENITSNDSLDISQINVKNPGNQTNIGKNVRTKGSVKISDVTIGHNREKNER